MDWLLFWKVSNQFILYKTKDERLETMSKKIKVNCAKCGKEKEIYPHQWKGSKTKLFFCDNTCSSQYYDRGITRAKEEKKLHCWVCGCKKHEDNGICKSSFFRTPHNLEKMGFDASAIGTERVFEELELLKDKLERLYYEEKKSLPELCRLFGIPSNITLQKIFNILDIKRRTPTDGSVISNSRNGYRTGYHTSWEGNKVHYRSSYEHDYMKELDKAKIPYQGEGFLKFEYYDTKLNKKRIAYPDFYLPESNTIVEVKSNWTYNPQEMVDKVKAYKEAGYNFKLILEHRELELCGLAQR